MIFRFNQNELSFLNEMCTQVQLIAIKAKDTDGGTLARKLNRLRKKFTPNALVVYLKKAERATLLRLTSQVVASAGSMVPGEKVEVAQGLIEKLETTL